MITERQVEILNSVVQEYIDSAQPVSSQLLEKKHKFEVCPATIRIEMQKLTDGGYLCQPHTSAGRVPTDKGYRFFVDELLERGIEYLKNGFEIEWVDRKGDPLKFTKTITDFLASESSNLALGYLSSEKVLWKEGWRGVFEEPEFAQAGFASGFLQIIDDFEKNIEDLLSGFPTEIQIYIGQENPISKNKDFSIIASKFVLPDYEEIFAIVGPKRMSYQKNISLFNSLVHLLK